MTATTTTEQAYFDDPALVERACVGALLLLPLPDVLDVLALVRDDDPADPRIRVVLKLVREVAAKGERPDAAALWRHGQATGAVRSTRLGAFGALLAELTGAEAVPVPLSARANATAVVEAAVRRRVVEAVDRLRQAADVADVDTLPAVVGTELAALAAECRRLSHPPAPTPRPPYTAPEPPRRPDLGTTSWRSQS